MKNPRFSLLAVISLAALVTTGCPNPGIPENTISFTLDGVEHAYSVSTGPSTHAWGQGWVVGSQPPYEYRLTASESTVDAEAGTNTIELVFGADGVYYLQAFVYDDAGNPMVFYLGAADITLLADIVQNLDSVGEQMQGAFLGEYTWANGSTHTLTNVVFSVERLEDYYPPQ